MDADGKITQQIQRQADIEYEVDLPMPLLFRQHGCDSDSTVTGKVAIAPTIEKV